MDVTRRHVLVGSGVAALAAAESIRQADSRATITMVSAEDVPFYSRPALAYLLTNELPESQLSIRSEREVAALGIERVTGLAEGLDAAAHELALSGGRRISYDRLLIATGAASIQADFPGAALDGAVHVDGLSEARDFVARARRARAAVVVGGGSTALELVEALQACGVATHYLMRGSRYWSKVFDAVESAIIEAQLIEQGVQLHRGCTVREAVGAKGVLTGVNTVDGRHIPCDLLAVAVGIRPRLELARAGGVATERGILTNEYLETSAADVYAAGDVAQIYDPVTRMAQLDTLWASALAQGTTAGLNMSGVRVAHRKRAPMNVTRLGGITVTIVGQVGASEDPDLLTLTRGQSERWMTDTDSWSVSGARTGDRLRVIVSGRVIVGAVVVGDQRVSRPLAHLVGEAVDISQLRPMLDANPNDAMDLLLSFCDAHVSDRTADHY